MSHILSNKLVAIGWLLFLICLILPAAIENEGAVYGYQYAKLSIEMIFDDYDGWPLISMSGLGNILAAIGILIVISKHPAFLLFFMVLFLMFGLNNSWYYIGGMEDFAVGYFAWVASYFFMSAGYLSLAWRQRPNKSAQSDACFAGASGLNR
jgi:hypothetical protein